MGRREMLRGSLTAGGLLVAGFEPAGLSRWLAVGSDSGGAGDGEKLGAMEFSGEAPVPMGTILGVGLDGRLYTDLSRLGPEERITAADNFYVRTRASDLLPKEKGWGVRIGGPGAKASTLPAEELARNAKSMGTHLMECSGNTRSIHFGLLSAAEWSGVPVMDVLGSGNGAQKDARVLVSGFDEYPQASTSSQAGASWIFRQDQFKEGGAFLATDMNGSPLSRDHGAPVRLVMPGWYGCACIKWVNEIRWVGEDAETTVQMREFAARTQQAGVPKLARDYADPAMETAAMPVRIEKWRGKERLEYRVTGIVWGGRQKVEGLEIRFNPEEEYAAVQEIEREQSGGWRFWRHRWMPAKPGAYLIRLRVKDSKEPTRRLDKGYYMRSVEIEEVYGSG